MAAFVELHEQVYDYIIKHETDLRNIVNNNNDENTVLKMEEYLKKKPLSNDFNGLSEEKLNEMIRKFKDKYVENADIPYQTGGDPATAIAIATGVALLCKLLFISSRPSNTSRSANTSAASANTSAASANTSASVPAVPAAPASSAAPAPAPVPASSAAPASSQSSFASLFGFNRSAAPAAAPTPAATNTPASVPTVSSTPAQSQSSFASLLSFKSDPLQDVYDAYFTDISNNDNLDAYRLYEYKRCIDYIGENTKATKLLDKMREKVLAILNHPDRNKHLPIDIELKEELLKIKSLQTSIYSDAKDFLKDYKPDEKMITIKPDKSRDEDKKGFLPIIEIAATDEDFAKNVVLLGTNLDDYEIKMMKMEGLQWPAMEKIVWDVSKTPPKLPESLKNLSNDSKKVQIFIGSGDGLGRRTNDPIENTKEEWEEIHNDQKDNTFQIHICDKNEFSDVMRLRNIHYVSNNNLVNNICICYMDATKVDQTNRFLQKIPRVNNIIQSEPQLINDPNVKSFVAELEEKKTPQTSASKQATQAAQTQTPASKESTNATKPQTNTANTDITNFPIHVKNYINGIKNNEWGDEYVLQEFAKIYKNHTVFVHKYNTTDKKVVIQRQYENVTGNKEIHIQHVNVNGINNNNRSTIDENCEINNCNHYVLLKKDDTYPYEIYDTVADGSCMFDALAQGLIGEYKHYYELTEDQKKKRQTQIEELRKNIAESLKNTYIKMTDDEKSAFVAGIKPFELEE
jgi:hypothetical protein